MKTLVLFALTLITCSLAQNNNQVFRGIVGRKWYYGGTFTSALQTDGTNLTTSNLVSWNGTRWENIGSEFPNGNVDSITTDLCRNVYVGGLFTAVGKSTTGPAARYNTFKKTWEQIGVSGDLTWSNDAQIYDIAVNCRNWPDSSLQCPCSVYLVGRFTATIKKSGKVATNVIKYEFSKKEWDDLGGNATHGMGTGEVYAVNLKEFGATEAIYNVWFAGSFPGKFQKFNTETPPGKWGFTDTTVPSKINGDILSIFYKTETGTTTDKVYFSGNFTSLPAAVGTCERVCYFDYKTEKFYAVGTSNIPNDVVNDVKVNGNVVIIGGAFTNPSTKYVAKLGTSGAWEPLGSNDASVVTSSVNIIDVCSTNSLQYDCTGGSTGVAGNGLSKYFDAKSNTWSEFGRGLVGTTSTVSSQFSSATSLSLVFSLTFTVLSALLIVF